MSRYFKSIVLRGENRLAETEGTVLRVTRKLSFFPSINEVLLVTKKSFRAKRAPYVIRECEQLHDGDIVKLHADGRITRLWDIASDHNALFVTGACNLRCRMCPQPPESDNEVYHKDNLRTLELLTVKELHLIGITGGEPFLFPDRVIEYFKIINRKFPTAEVEILTNATLLEKFEVAKKVALEAPLKTTFCVSLHADTARCYEYINQRTGSFEKTIRGIESLAKLHQSIEIRPVITAANAAFLEDIARFIYRNFPYVTHVAFMGQEIVGDAVLNLKDIWVEPIHYVSNLCRATTLLSDSGLFVSIYNLPLCLLPESHHKFAARSISDWKQEYSETCSICKKKDQCCGFFTTSESHIPMGIHAL